MRLVLLTSAVGLLLFLIAPFLKPLLLGMVFAIVLYPVYKKPFLSRISPHWRAFVVTILFAVMVLIPFGVILFIGADTALEKFRTIPNGGQAGAFDVPTLIRVTGLATAIEKLLEFLPLSRGAIEDLVRQTVTAAGQFLVGFLQEVLSGLPQAGFSLVIILVTTFFLLVDGPGVVHFGRTHSFFSPTSTEKLMTTFQSLCFSVVVASVITGFVQASLLTVFVLLTGTGNVLMLFLLTFLASFFPVIGTAPVTLGIALHHLASGDVIKGGVFLGAAVLIGVVDNFVRPMAMKGNAQIHPLAAFVSAFGALQVIGVSGLFLGPIVAGLVQHLLPLMAEEPVEPAMENLRVPLQNQRPPEHAPDH